MHTVLRCWERQSDGSEYKKTLRRPGLRPDPADGTYSAPANTLVGVEGLDVPSPRTPSPALGPSGLASSTPTPKLVPTPMVTWLLPVCRHLFSEEATRRPTARAQFINKFDKRFNAFNSRMVKSSQLMGHAFTRNSAHEKFFSEMLNYLDRLHLADSSRSCHAYLDGN